MLGEPGESRNQNPETRIQNGGREGEAPDGKEIRMTNEEGPHLEIEDRGGETPSTSIIIPTSSHFVGVLAEYACLAKKFGKQDVDWKLEMKAVGGNKERLWDMMVVKLKDGTEKTIYFDITEFFEKR
jgi:hypothetical protein